MNIAPMNSVMIFLIILVVNAIVTRILLQSLSGWLMDSGVYGYDVNKPEKTRVPEEGGVSEVANVHEFKPDESVLRLLNLSSHHPIIVVRSEPLLESYPGKVCLESSFFIFWPERGKSKLNPVHPSFRFRLIFNY